MNFNNAGNYRMGKIPSKTHESYNHMLYIINYGNILLLEAIKKPML